MKCDVCNAEVSKGFLHSNGNSCSEDCSQILQGRRKAILDELRAEPIGQMPDKLDTMDFERFTLKFSVHFLDALKPKDRNKLKRNNPMMLLPEQFALEVKDQILRHIKPCYVSETEARGHERMFHGGSYCFRQPVPSEHVVDAMRKANLIQ